MPPPNPLNQITDEMARALQRLQSSFGGFLDKMANSISGLSGSVTKFVEKASPVSVMLLTRAVEDFNAVIGQILTPALRTLTQVIRGFGDVLINLSPGAKTALQALVGFTAGITVAAIAIGAAGAILNALTGGLPMVIGALAGVAGAFLAIGGVTEQMKPLFAAFGRILETVLGAVMTAFMPFLIILESLTPVLEAVGEVVASLVQLALLPIMSQFQLLGAYLRFIAPMIMLVARAIAYLANQLLSLLGVQKFEMQKSSVGAAVKNAEIGSLESFISSQTVRSFKGAEPEDVQGQMSSSLSDIKKNTDVMIEWLRAKKDQVEKGVKTAGAAASAAGDVATSSAAGLINPALGIFMAGRSLLRNIRS